MTLHVRAPGKLMLSGEYCVLAGAPSLVMAVDRGVTIDVEPAEGEVIRYSMGSPLSSSANIVVTPSGSVTHLDGDPATTALLRTIIAAAIDAGCDPNKLRGVSIHAHIDEMFTTLGGDTVKLGLGSSAASSVALTAAVMQLGAMDTSLLSRCTLALDAHRRFQGGRGSGADVAASAHGGVVRYQLPKNTRDGDRLRPTIQALDASALPPWRAVWVGQPASTTRFIEHVHALRARDAKRHDACMTTLTDASERAAAAFAQRNQSALLGALEDIGAGMDALGVAAGVEIITEAHRRLSSIARRHGVVCKPSGAGGGDFSLLIADTPSALEAAIEEVAEAPGLFPMDLEIAPA